MVEATVKALGGIDIRDNNVGIVRVGGPWEIDEADWDRVAEVNLKSAFLVCRAVIPQMLRRGGGAIVNISSIAGIRHTGVDYVTYATTKGALLPFSLPLALHYPHHGIHYTRILPRPLDPHLSFSRLPPASA